MPVLTTVIAVIVVLGGLIFFHELGHFAVARSLGMGVSTFSLGFGPKILKYKKGKTEYALSLVPLGGYVALVGESDANEIPDGFTEQESFALRPAWQRLLVVGGRACGQRAAGLDSVLDYGLGLGHACASAAGGRRGGGKPRRSGWSGPRRHHPFH